MSPPVTPDEWLDQVSVISPTCHGIALPARTANTRNTGPLPRSVGRPMRSTTPYRTSAEPTRKSPGTSGSPPSKSHSASATPSAPPTATSHRGSQEDGSSTSSPSTAYWLSASPGCRHACPMPRGSSRSRRRSSRTRGFGAPRRVADSRNSVNPMPNSSEKIGKKRWCASSSIQPLGFPSVAGGLASVS
ncbi:hypothetical protein AB6N24_02810 [Cellulomonas sp. 179-A 4D5 NHS]|uniref:hypothetical protein n=1 Tax=Cellulomonas sp. 179-A 4D5 NHS TaxID=3142378 RepID=UPI0039A1353B